MGFFHPGMHVLKILQNGMQVIVFKGFVLFRVVFWGEWGLQTPKRYQTKFELFFKKNKLFKYSNLWVFDFFWNKLAQRLLSNGASVNEVRKQALADDMELTPIVTSHRLPIVSPNSGDSSSHEESTTYQNISPGNP